MLAVGNKAPAFNLPDQDGKTVSLKSLLSTGAVVLYFYPKDDTPGCTKEACSFRDDFSAFKKAGAQIVGVSKDSAAAHTKFRAKYKLPFALLADEDTHVVQAYGVWKDKVLYGRKFKGVERTTVVIDKKGVIRAIFPKVKVDGHSDAVLAAVKAL
ncbi:MAG: thioredoxin-dependent thiol peroxidase [Deltaproteobacteria bacterium]|nr:thioredoxin-dependent thiol peroxidase [Deltaproteobacteria bacterium]MBI3390569.1 thioredoxin-dependent thiol peroxidase [Deltaproteobacteria bacterium]